MNISSKFCTSIFITINIFLIGFFISGCRPNVSQIDSDRIARLVHPYSVTYNLAGPRGIVEWSVGDEATIQSEIDGFIEDRKKIFDNDHLQVDSISNDTRLVYIKNTLHSILSKQERSLNIHNLFIPSLWQLNNAYKSVSKHKVDSLLLQYKNLFSEYNHLYDQLVIDANNYNKTARDLQLPDTINVVHFDKVTHKEIVEWFYILDDSTKKLILDLH